MWKKIGLVFDAHKYANHKWFCNSALTPQPFSLDDQTIRVFAGFRDAEGVSRIGYVDLSASDPTKVIKVSERPVLDVGRNGCFDDNGVILGDVIRTPSGIYLFYVGFQLVKKAKFLAFSGAALSEDGGETFVRISESPILERDRFQSTIGAIHTARYENDIWRLWFARGDGWEIINGVPYPKYHICYTETKDLLNIPRSVVTCAVATLPEYRIGRPKVYQLANGTYVMYATKGTLSGEYTPSFFRSKDGIQWERDDAALGIAPSEGGWDSETLCYPALIKHTDQTLMIYNGNKMGVDGFGAALSNQVILA
jgi:hypothetical protein